MIDPITLFRDGGPFMYLVLLAGPVAFLGALTPLLAVLLKRHIPTAVPLGLVMLPALLGVLGGLQGLGQVAKVVDLVSPEMLAQMAAQGLSVCLFTVIAGSFVTGLAGLLAATVDAIASLFGHREPEHTPGTQASRRNGALVLAAVGFAGVGTGWVAMRYAMYWRALAVASREMRATLMAQAMSGVTVTAAIAAGAVMLCLAAALVHALAVPASRTPRTAIGAAVGLAVLLPTLALPLLRAGTALDIIEVATPWSQRRAEVLAVDPIELPTSEVFADGFPARVTVRTTSAGVGRVDGPRGPTTLEAARTDDGRARMLRVEATGNTRLEDLWSAVGSHVEATVRAPNGELATLYVGRAPEQLPDACAVFVLDGANAELRFHYRGTDEVVAVGALRDLAGLHADRFVGESVAHVPTDATLADVIQVHEALGWAQGRDRRRGPYTIWWTTDPAPSLPEERMPD